MDGIEQEEEQARRANELYWESETSVNRIADELGLSKGSLYAAIEPLASESMCPLCQEPLVYANRTALDKGHLQCVGCGTEFEEKGAAPLSERSVMSPATGDGGPPVERRDEPTAAAREQDETEVIGDVTRAPVDLRDRSASGVESDRPSGQLVLGTGMLALGVGLLVARVFRR